MGWSCAHYGEHYLTLVTDPLPPPLKAQLLPLARPLSLLVGPRPTKPQLVTSPLELLLPPMVSWAMGMGNGGGRGWAPWGGGAGGLSFPNRGYGVCLQVWGMQLGQAGEYLGIIIGS